MRGADFDAARPQIGKRADPCRAPRPVPSGRRAARDLRGGRRCGGKRLRQSRTRSRQIVPKAMPSRPPQPLSLVDGRSGAGGDWSSYFDHYRSVSSMPDQIGHYIDHVIADPSIAGIAGPAGERREEPCGCSCLPLPILRTHRPDWRKALLERVMEEALVLTRTSHVGGETRSPKALRRALRRRAMIWLDRMLPPRPSDREADLPPEWFKFSPF
jgi:hypothetical protein